MSNIIPFMIPKVVFVKKKSTEHALLDIFNQVDTNMGAELYSCGIFIDLRKAFDTVDHQISLSKLHHYWVQGTTNHWFSSYLLGHQQTTQIGGNNTSKKETILSGVLQGSVLGPLLFLIYENDISNSAGQLKFSLFADDTHMLYADRNLKSLETMVNGELFNLYDWLTAMKLPLNIKKSNFVIFRPIQKLSLIHIWRCRRS